VGANPRSRSTCSSKACNESVRPLFQFKGSFTEDYDRPYSLFFSRNSLCVSFDYLQTMIHSVNKDPKFDWVVHLQLFRQKKKNDHSAFDFLNLVRLIHHFSFLHFNFYNVRVLVVFRILSTGNQVNLDSTALR
jgi:hypothetical protein